MELDTGEAAGPHLPPLPSPEEAGPGPAGPPRGPPPWGGGGGGGARPALGLESFRAPRCGRLVTGDALRAVREISAPWAPTTESSAEA